MLKTFRIVFDSISSTTIAFYLSYVFSDVFLKGIMPPPLQLPSLLLSSVGFLFVLRWLRKEGIPQPPATSQFPVAQPIVQNTALQKGFIMWETQSPSSHLLQARAVSELVKLLKQSRRQRKDQEAQIQLVVAQTVTQPTNPKAKACASPKGCHFPKEHLS